MSWAHKVRQTTTRRMVRLGVEELESRVTPYALSGDLWVHPQLVTISFVPDGTVLGSNGLSYLKSNLFSTFNSKFGSAAKWENEILRAAQTWAASTNVNFAVVPDDGSTIGSGPDQQGDPNKGDIRIGGYNFGFGNANLAQTEMPPKDNNYSVAGDIQFNTGQSFNVGTTYDLYSVALHEFGHALGLDHSSVGSAVMYPTYSGTKFGLSSDDIAGVRAIYSNGNARSPDPYDAGATPNNSFAAASNLTSQINATSKTALVTGLDITTTSDVDYHTFTAPSGTSGTLTVTVQSNGLSLLSPRAWVYAADQSTILGYASGAGQYGTTLTITVNNVTAGQQFYVKVAGADGSVLSTGAYALALNFGTGPSPTVTPPNTLTPNGSPLSGGGGMSQNPGLLPALLYLLFGQVLKDFYAAPAAALPVATGPAGGGPNVASSPAAAAPAAPGGGEGTALPPVFRLLASPATVLGPAANPPPGAVPLAGPTAPPPAVVVAPTARQQAPFSGRTSDSAWQTGGASDVPAEELPATEVPTVPVVPAEPVAAVAPAEVGRTADPQASVPARPDPETPGAAAVALPGKAAAEAVTAESRAETMPMAAALLAVLGSWMAVPPDQAVSRRRPGERGTPGPR
jgi:hypothetical protein